MKLSHTNDVFKYIRLAGIHSNPETLTREELGALAKDPTVKDCILQAINKEHLNLYQEMEMESPSVDIHRDISHQPENLQLHSHNFYELIYCETGDIQYLIGDKRYRIHSGDIILVPPGISHRPIFYSEMTEPYSRIVMWLSTNFIQYITVECPDFFLHSLHKRGHYLLRTKGTDYYYIRKYFLQGLKEAMERAPIWEVSLYSNATALLVHLARALLSTDGFFPIEKDEEIDKIISYIENYYAQKITLEDTAKSFHISSSSLSKMFASKLGISFYQFVTQRRLINSKLKIEAGDPMEDIALTCGFGDYSTFYRAFKKEYGISPREYKQMVQ